MGDRTTQGCEGGDNGYEHRGQGVGTTTIWLRPLTHGTGIRSRGPPMRADPQCMMPSVQVT